MLTIYTLWSSRRVLRVLHIPNVVDETKSYMSRVGISIGRNESTDPQNDGETGGGHSYRL